MPINEWDHFARSNGMPAPPHSINTSQPHWHAHFFHQITTCFDFYSLILVSDCLCRYNPTSGDSDELLPSSVLSRKLRYGLVGNHSGSSGAFPHMRSVAKIPPWPWASLKALSRPSHWGGECSNPALGTSSPRDHTIPTNAVQQLLDLLNGQTQTLVQQEECLTQIEREVASVRANT